MTFSRIANTIKDGILGGTSSLTSDAVDTTGANLLIVASSFYTLDNITTTDSKGNTPYVALTAQRGATHSGTQIHYFLGGTVGSGHTFTITSDAQVFYGLGIGATAYSGAKASSPFDQQNGGGTSSGTTVQPGSITPTEDNELVFSCVANRDNVDVISIDGGFTLLSHSGGTPSQTYGHGHAELIQTSAAAANPTFTCGGAADEHSAVIASFKTVSAGIIINALRGPLAPVGYIG